MISAPGAYDDTTTGNGQFGNGRGWFLGSNEIVEDITARTWYHIIATYDNTNKKMSLYVNGVENSLVIDGNLKPYTDDGLLSIGLRPQGEVGLIADAHSFKGRASKVRIYNRSLSSDEVLQHYTSEKPIVPIASIQPTGNDAVLGASEVVENSAFGKMIRLHSTELAENPEVKSIQSGDISAGTSFTVEGWFNFSLDNAFETYDSLFIHTTPVTPVEGSTLDVWDYGLWRTTTLESPPGNNYGDGTNVIGFGVRASSTTPANRIGIKHNDLRDWWVNGTKKIDPNKWYHIAGTYDAPKNTLSIYVNGEQDASYTIPVTPNIEIGNGGTLSASGFNGSITRLRVYNTTLSPQEIKRHYILESPILSSQQSSNSVLMSDDVKISDDVNI